jgi:hypothetical protein
MEGAIHFGRATFAEKSAKAEERETEAMELFSTHR